MVVMEMWRLMSEYRTLFSLEVVVVQIGQAVKWVPLAQGQHLTLQGFVWSLSFNPVYPVLCFSLKVPASYVRRSTFSVNTPSKAVSNKNL